MARLLVYILIGFISTALAQSSEETLLKSVLSSLDSELLGDDILKFLACLDGNCDIGVKPSSSTPTASTSTQTASTVLPEQKAYSDLCVNILAKKDLLMKDPKIKALESRLWGYLESVISAYQLNPLQKKEIILQFLDELLQMIVKLKVIIDKEFVEQTTSTQSTITPTEEIISEEAHIYPPFIGSIRGIPGVHYPNYTEVPITSFSCGNKKYIPGFYADMETGCQVFHVCYEHRRESFLCPVGTIFNQPILACDYWYSSNCSLSSHYYDVNIRKEEVSLPEKTDEIQEIITTIIEQEKPILPKIQVKTKEAGSLKAGLEQIVKFLPIKAKILEFPSKAKIVKPVVASTLVKAAIPSIKAKLAMAAAAPIFSAGKVKGVAKTKVAAVPIVKAKVATAKVPVKTAVKGKIIAAKAVPLVKTKVAVASAPLLKAVPVAKVKLASAAALPIVKTKIAAVPLAKATVVKPKLMFSKTAAMKAPLIKGKAAMISPLTKKALALGYMKLLKAKKLALG